MKAATPLGLLILFTCVSAHAQVSSLPGQHFGYVMSQQSGTLLVLDTRTNDIVKRVKHADMVKPAGGSTRVSSATTLAARGRLRFGIRRTSPIRCI